MQKDAEYQAEVHAFASLVRAKMTTLETMPSSEHPSEAEVLWNQVHGSGRLRGTDVADLERQLTELIARKSNVAAGVVLMLVYRLADLEGKPAAQVVDELERHIAELLPGDE